MTYKVMVDNGVTRIDIDFADEGVSLQGKTYVKGGEAEALGYLPIFEQDLRKNYSEMFPKPEPGPEPMEEMMI